MHLVPDAQGPFPYRPYFRDGEIDRLMDEFLDSVGRPRVDDLLAINIELAMLRAGVEPIFDVLPESLEGLTLFGANGSSRILIATELADRAKDDPVILRRLRTTLGHEFGHSRLHAKLFTSSTVSMGAEGFALPYVSCNPAGSKYAGWWEWQANAAMAALLMPRRDFTRASREWHRLRGVPSAGWEGIAYEEYLQEMGRTFLVSREAAAYRAEALGFPRPLEGPTS